MAVEYEERLKAIQADAVGAAWDPLLHPRARDGKFIKVNGWVRGLFRIAGSMQQLNGRVVGVRANKRDDMDPIVKVLTKHGEHETVVSQITNAIEPKGFLSKVAEKVGLAEPEDPMPFDPVPESLEGDIHFVTGQPLEGRDLNGIALTEMDFDPRSVPDKDVGEPPLPEADKHLKQSSGVLIEEPDGRIWFYEPANHFGGYTSTFSKGRVEDEDTMQQAALREAFEELGLVAEITGYVGDYKGSVTMTRMYRGKRIGGAPWKHDSEVAEVRLMAPDTASEMLHTERDQQILSDFTGDPKYIDAWKEAHPPPPPKPKWEPKKWKDKKGGKPLSMSDQMDALFGLYDDYVAEPPEDDDKLTALELTKKYGGSRLGADIDPVAEAGPAGADGRFIRPGMYVHGRFTDVDGNEQVLRLEVQALEPNTEQPNDPIVYALDADGNAVASTVSQLTAVPATQAELDAAKAEFSLRFIKSKMAFDKTVQGNSPKPRKMGELLWSEITHSGGDGLPTDFMYEVEAAATAVGKVIDDEIERRIVVYSGEGLLTDAEFAAKRKALVAQMETLNAEANELVKNGLDIFSEQVVAVHNAASNLSLAINRLENNRRHHREAYAKHAREVLEEIVPGGIGGELKFGQVVTPGVDPEAVDKRVQETVGTVYPTAWIEASNAGAANLPISIKLDEKRAYYDFNKGHMRLPDNIQSAYFNQVAVHEFGHRMEQVVPEIKMLEYAFFYRRNDKGAIPPQPLNVVLGVPNIPGAPYGVNELTRPDKFTNPYMGRDYGGGPGSHYELFTSGVERLIAAVNQPGVQGTNGLLRDDADYRAWTMGVLAVATPTMTEYDSGVQGPLFAAQDLEFKVFLNDGRVINAKRIEQDDDGNISVISTLGERFFPAQIAKVYKPGEAPPAPKDVGLLNSDIPPQERIEALATAAARADAYVDRLIEQQRVDAERYKAMTTDELLEQTGPLASLIWRQRRGMATSSYERDQADVISDNPEVVALARTRLRRKFRKIERANGEPEPWFTAAVDQSVETARANPKIAALEEIVGVPVLQTKVVRGDTPTNTPTAEYSDSGRTITFFQGGPNSISGVWAGDEDTEDHHTSESDELNKSDSGPAFYRHEFGHHVESVLGEKDQRIWQFKDAWNVYKAKDEDDHNAINLVTPGFAGYDARTELGKTKVSYYSLENWREGWAETFRLITDPLWDGDASRYSPETQELIRIATDIVENPVP